MRASRPVGVLAGLTAVGLASLLVASPASAATLPVGQKITVVEQIPNNEGPGGSRMWTASPVNAVLTDNLPVQVPPYIEAIDVNDDGFGYATENRFNAETGYSTFLWAANATTGALTGGVPIVPALGFDFTISECNGLDLQPNGEIIIACASRALNGTYLNSYLGVVTPAGVFTPFFDSQEQEDITLVWSALAFNAVTGQLWAFVYDSAAYPVNRAANPWVIGAGIGLGQDVYGADFDRSGQLFVTDAGDGTELQTLDLTVVPGTFTLIGLMRDSSDNIVSPVLAITVWGKTLPATGPAEIVPIGLGTALLFLAGAAFIATSRIQRKQA